MIMQVKAKFMCSHFADVTYQNNWTQRKVFFNAIYGTEGENADFSKATPSGLLEIVIDQSTPAYDFFKPGESYYLTFEKTNN